MIKVVSRCALIEKAPFTFGGHSSGLLVQVVTSTGSKELLSKKKVENIKLEKLTIGVSKRKNKKHDELDREPHE